MTPVQRDKQGRVVHGTLNPSGRGGERGGRPRLAYREALRQLEPLAIATLIRAMQASNQDSVRLAAARDVLDRLHGRAAWDIHMSGDSEVIHRHYVAVFEPGGVHPDTTQPELGGPTKAH